MVSCTNCRRSPIPMDEVDAGNAGAATPVGHPVHPSFHARPRPGQFGIRLLDIRRCCCGFSTPTETLFQTGWFVESLATQVLVIFVIRTGGNPFRSRPNPVARGNLTRHCGRWNRFCPIPQWVGGSASSRCRFAFLAALCAMVVCYLVLAEGVKRWFYRRYPPHGVTRSPIPHRPMVIGTRRCVTPVRLTSRTDFRTASPNRDGCASARSGMHSAGCAVVSLRRPAARRSTAPRTPFRCRFTYWAARR